MNLYFDTETSGLWRESLQWDDPSQPHLLQLGAKLVDEQGRLVASVNSIFKPEGWSIEPEAERVHGISEIRAHKVGRQPRAALIMFQELTFGASKIVAHNFQFDWRVVALAIKRAGGDGLWWAQRRKDSACTMELATPIVKIPGRFGEFKWPKLEEAHDFFFPEQAPYVNRHDAISDLDACERIYLAIQGAKNGHEDRPSSGGVQPVGRQHAPPPG